MKNAMIILNYNDYETTSKYLNSIMNFDNIDMIVVVDNNSTDDSYKKLLKYKSNSIKIINSKYNKGYGYGNNIGIKYAVKILKDCNLIISNPDVTISPKVIDDLSRVINSNDFIAIAAPTINEFGKYNRGWKLTNGFKEVLLSIPKIGTIFKNKIIGYSSKHYDSEFSFVDAVSGCFFMINSKVFSKIDYFDENLFLYYEENVISKKLKKLGYKIVVLNNSFISHNHSTSINKNRSELSKFKLLKESQMYYVNNYCTAGKISKALIKKFGKIVEKYKSRCN